MEKFKQCTVDRIFSFGTKTNYSRQWLTSARSLLWSLWRPSSSKGALSFHPTMRAPSETIAICTTLTTRVSALPLSATKLQMDTSQTFQGFCKTFIHIRKPDRIPSLFVKFPKRPLEQNTRIPLGQPISSILLNDSPITT